MQAAMRVDGDRRGERARATLDGAIRLVADGPYPEVLISNLPGARAAAADLREEARRRGVELLVIEGPGTEPTVRVHRQ